tara:strand:- start:15 stop:458 length:444 start_codon:yes stop_codon:yes gene_type:complete
MKKKDTSKPLMLYLPESIYSNLIKIKNEDLGLNNIELIERFISTKEFDEIKNGSFHDNLFVKLKENNFLNFETGKKLPKETIDLLNLQKNTVMKQFKENSETYFAKSSFPLSSSQNAFGLVWRMCETYELWCKEVNKEKLIKLNFID